MLAIGAFLMQFTVQGAWGIVPVHLNELSPDDARGTFPGFVYQLGNLLASVNATLQATLAAHFGGNYGLALAIVAGTVAIIIAALTAAGTEAKGVVFGEAEAAACDNVRLFPSPAGERRRNSKASARDNNHAHCGTLPGPTLLTGNIGDHVMKTLAIGCVVLGVLLPAAAISRGGTGGMHHSASRSGGMTGGAAGTRPPRPAPIPPARRFRHPVPAAPSRVRRSAPATRSSTRRTARSTA